MIDSLTRFI